MVAFMTPHEMYDDYKYELERQAYLYEKTMYKYAFHAKEIIGEYAICIADAYFEGIKSAHDIFEKLGLGEIHAHAIQEDLAGFVEEYDKTEKYDYDV